ncbi:MAG: hypothetical protein HZB29_05475 [Nitrospinae bacterium]|nr:hypothetical protein [Nitrospinota bacterium]
MDMMKRITVAVLLVASAVFTASCGSTSGGSSSAGGSTDSSSSASTDTTTTPEPAPTECVAAHDNAAWTTGADCGPYTYANGGDYYNFDLSGAPNFLKGRISFKVVGLDDSRLPGDMMWLIFGKMLGNGNNEANFQYAMWAGGASEERIITQRFDGSCSTTLANGARGCEEQDRQTFIEWNGGTVYRFEVSWGDGIVGVKIYDSATDVNIYDGWISTHGDFYGADYIHVGNGAFPGYSWGVSGGITVSDLRLSILQ